MSDTNKQKEQVPTGPVPYIFRALGLENYTLEGATIRVVSMLENDGDALRFEGIVSYDDGGKK